MYIKMYISHPCVSRRLAQAADRTVSSSLLLPIAPGRPTDHILDNAHPSRPSSVWLSNRRHRNLAVLKDTLRDIGCHCGHGCDVKGRKRLDELGAATNKLYVCFMVGYFASGLSLSSCKTSVDCQRSARAACQHPLMAVGTGQHHPRVWPWVWAWTCAASQVSE